MLLLAVLETGPAHGYAILEALRDRSGGDLDLPEGTVYPALHRLEASGLVHSHWEMIAGRRRRVYAPTERGKSALREERQSWRSFVRTITAVAGGTT